MLFIFVVNAHLPCLPLSSCIILLHHHVKIPLIWLLGARTLEKHLYLGVPASQFENRLTDHTVCRQKIIQGELQEVYAPWTPQYLWLNLELSPSKGKGGGSGKIWSTLVFYWLLLYSFIVRGPTDNNKINISCLKVCVFLLLWPWNNPACWVLRWYVYRLYWDLEGVVLCLDIRALSRMANPTPLYKFSSCKTCLLDLYFQR